MKKLKKRQRVGCLGLVNLCYHLSVDGRMQIGTLI